MNKVIILAAGKGTRMNSELPKVLFPINKKPMIKYLLDSVIDSNIDSRPILVVSSSNKDLIKKSLHDYELNFAIQFEQLGTGNAVLSAKDFISHDIENVLILYGDHPFISSNSIKNIIKNHKGVFSMMTVKLDDFNDWRKNFYHWGRIIRESGEIKEIIEFKDASDEIKECKELNPAIFCFNKEWLFDNINNIKNNNKQKEYYLTDLVKIVFESGEKINFFEIDPKEAMGVNSLEELEIARKIAN